MRGRFITFEGGEGSGKSTQVAGLVKRLTALGLAVMATREPGGSPGAEAVRHVLLSGAAKPLGAHAEALLFAAARDDHVSQTIRPALEGGKWVVCDRFADSTRVYQGILSNVDPRIIARLEMKPLSPSEIIVTEGEAVPGLLLVGVGELELVKEDKVSGVVGSGEFLFPTEVLGAGSAPTTARAGPGGALVMFGDRALAQELLVTCPPLLEVFAGM